MATVRELARRAAIEIVNHIENNGPESVTYEESARMIRWFDKNGDPQAHGMGRVLGRMMDRLREFDAEAPCLSILVYSQSAGIPSAGFEYVLREWDDMDEQEKNKFIETEKESIIAYDESGKLKSFLVWLEQNH